MEECLVCREEGAGTVGENKKEEDKKICEYKRFKDILWLLLPPVLAQPVLGPRRHLLIYISFSSFTGNGRVMCS